MKTSKLILAFKMAKTHFMVGFVIAFYPLFLLLNSSCLIANRIEKLNIELNNIDNEIENLNKKT